METSKHEESVKNTKDVKKISGDDCRVCLEKCNETCQLFRNDQGIPQKLMAIAGVQVEEGDGLPSIICSSCYRLLDMSYNFKCQVQNSDVKLRQVLSLKVSRESDRNSCIDNPSIASVLCEVITSTETDHSDKDKVHLTEDIAALEVNLTAVQSNIQLNVQTFAKDHNTPITEPENISEQETCIEENITRDIEVTNDVLEEKSTSNECGQRNVGLDNLASETRILSGWVTETKSIKEEELSLHDEGEILCNEDPLADQTSVHREEIFKVEIKNDVTSTDDTLVRELDSDTFSDCAPNTVENDQDSKGGTNCSDDEEKPLISRASRQKCPHCIKTFTTKLALQRHMIVHKHKTKLRYVCHICDKQFSNIAKLKNHIFNNHDTNKNKMKDLKENQKLIQKDMAEKRINKSVIKSEKNCDSSQEIIKGDKKNFKYTCQVCSKQFTYQKPFITHARTHPEYKPKTHKIKAKTLLTDYESEEEEEAEEEDAEEEDDDDSDLPMESLQCTQCGKLFATKRNLKRHISTHSGLKFNCSTCGKAFSRLDKLRDHEQTKHKEDMFGNSDEEAENDTDNENKLNDTSENQKKDRRNRPHKCALCPKAFAQPQSLANHVERHKRVKDTQKRFLCEVCSKCFAQSGSLVAHMRTHTGVKPYVCNVCSRAFTKSTYLQLHLRTHSGEKPYICQYCSRAFARANTLARHITMHTGEAKYHCQICTKSFRRLTSLNEHTYTHTGQRPYACKICTKRYNNAGSLYAHSKKCKAQQLPVSTATFTVSMDNSSQQNGPMPHVLIYSQRKLMEDATVGQVTPTPQYMIANVHNQKTLPTNVIQPFTVDDPSLYTVNSKQFKNPYYAIYPNM